MSRSEHHEWSRIELTAEERVVREQAFARFLDWMFSVLVDEGYFESGRNVFQRNDVPNVDLDGETQNIEIAVRTWWEKRDWIRLFYIDFAKLHFTWPPSGGDWPGLVADIILAYEEGDASKIARAHYALAEGYFYEGGLAFPDSVLNCHRSDACISECRKAVEIQPANLEFRHFLIYLCAQFSRAFEALTECLNMMRVDPSEAKKSTTGNSPEFYLTNSNVMDPRRYYSRLTLEEKRRAETLLMPLGDTIPAQNLTLLAGFGFQAKPMLRLCEQGAQESAVLPVPPEQRASAADWPTFHGNNGRTGHAVEAIVPPLKELWCFDAGTELGSGPVVSGGRVLVGTRESLKQGRLLAVDANSGKKLWEFPTNGMITSHAAVHDGLVYFGCWDTRFYAVDLQTGRAVWHFTSAPKAIGPFDGIWNGNALVVNDMVTALAQDLYILDAKTGKQIWKCRNPEYAGSSPAENEGLLYVGFYRELAIIDLAKKKADRIARLQSRKDYLRPKYLRRASSGRHELWSYICHGCAHKGDGVDV